jgi:hypothetical protein
MMQDFLFERLSRLYAEMEQAYDRVADQIGLSCDGCSDNCCKSYFQHHTYVEWIYLWQGIKSSSDKEKQRYINRAREYVTQCASLLAQGSRPRIMCPLNEDGRCQLYEYRLMICRLHGVPNSFVMPDGKKVNFPGCFRCQALCSDLKEVPVLDRTRFYRDLASLEMTFLQSRSEALPKVNLTLAQMLVQTPPQI